MGTGKNLKKMIILILESLKSYTIDTINLSSMLPRTDARGG